MDYRTAVEKALNKENDSWEYLYENTYNEMYFCALMLLNSKSDAEDVVQTAYLQAYKKLDSLKEPEKFPAWMKRIVVNAAYRYQEKNKPLLFFGIEDDEGGEIEYEIEDDNDTYNPVASVEQADIKCLLNELIDDLPNEQRQTLLLYHYEGLNQNVIADYFSCSVNTVKSRLMYARKKLRENLDKMTSKGYALNGVAPVPFMVHLLDRQKNSATFAKTVKTAMQATSMAMEASTNVSAVTGTTVISSAAGGAIGRASLKLIEGLATVLLLTGAVCGLYGLKNNFFTLPFEVTDSDTQLDNSSVKVNYVNDEIYNSDSDVGRIYIDNYVGRNFIDVKEELESQSISIKQRNEASNQEYGVILEQSLEPGYYPNKDVVITFVLSVPIEDNQSSTDSSTDSDAAENVAVFLYFSASSQLAPDGVVDNVVIRKDNLCWSEGVDGVGVGEYVTFFNEEDSASVSSVGIINGWAKDEKTFRNNGRLTKVTFQGDDPKDKFTFAVNPDSMDEQILYFDRTINTKSLKIIIDGAVKGDETENTCISLIVPYK